MTRTAPPQPVIRRVPAVTRAIALLKALSHGDEPRYLNSLAQELGLVPSTCLHILRALSAEGLVAVDPKTKRYSLDAGLLPIARAVLRQNNVVALAQPLIEKFSADHNLTTTCVRLIGIDRMIVLGKCDADSPIRMHIEIGSRFPALISATGRCLAAFSDRPHKEILANWKALRWDNPPKLEEWLADVERARHQRYGVDRDCYIAGATIICAPILDKEGRMTYALNAVGLSSQMRRIGLANLGRELTEIARSVESSLQ